MSKAGFCQHDAGVLKDDALSPGAKNKFIEDVKSYLILGSADAPPLPIPCPIEVDPIPFADQIELENEEKYPEWHANVLGLYEKIAKALDFKSQFTILPICDPLALAVALNLDIPKLNFPGDFALLGLALPLLAFELGFKIPVDLALEFPGLLTIPPGIALDLPIPPDIKLPDFDALFEFAFPFPKFPDLLLGLMLKMPSLFLGILSFDLGVFCDAVVDSKLFGDFDPNSAIVWAVSNMVLASKTAECVAIAAVGGTLGSASGGVTGTLGDFFGYEPPPMETVSRSIRDKIVQNAEDHNGDSHGKDKKALADSGEPIEGNPPLSYTDFLYAIRMNPPPEFKKNKHQPDAAFRKQERMAAWALSAEQSSCELFGRAVFRGAGSRFKRFLEPYGQGQVFDVKPQLQNCREQHGAQIEFSINGDGDFPALKKGDAIMVAADYNHTAHHFAILAEDYPGGLSGPGSGGPYVRVIHGGQNDPDNVESDGITPKPTAIGQAQYKIWIDPNEKRVRAGTTGNPWSGQGGDRFVVLLFNGAKMVDPNSEE